MLIPSVSAFCAVVPPRCTFSLRNLPSKWRHRTASQKSTTNVRKLHHSIHCHQYWWKNTPCGWAPTNKIMQSRFRLAEATLCAGGSSTRTIFDLLHCRRPEYIILSIDAQTTKMNSTVDRTVKNCDFKKGVHWGQGSTASPDCTIVSANKSNFWC